MRQTKAFAQMEKKFLEEKNPHTKFRVHKCKCRHKMGHTKNEWVTQYYEEDLNIFGTEEKWVCIHNHYNEGIEGLPDYVPKIWKKLGVDIKTWLLLQKM